MGCTQTHGSGTCVGCRDAEVAAQTAEILKLRQIIARRESHQDLALDELRGETDRLKASLELMHGAYNKAKLERSKLRELFEWQAQRHWDMGCDIEFCDWQDESERLGLLVEVPASEDFAREHDTDVMFTWAWNKGGR